MAWDEWEQLKTEAAKKKAAHTELNQAMNTSSGGGDTDEHGDLTVNKPDLVAIGKSANRLYSALDHWGDHARISSMKAAGGLTSGGFDVGDGLDHVAERWVDQVQSLLDACAHISNHLQLTMKIHTNDDQHIRGTISSISQLDKGFDHREGEK